MNAHENFMIERRSYAGGSDVAAIYGVSPYATPTQLWLEKTGQRTPPPPDKYKKRILERGHRLEPIVVEMALDKLREQGHEVELIATNERYYDPDYPFLSCEIDFELMFNGEHINGDAKTVQGFARNSWGEEETDEIPLHYHLQFLHGMGITRRRRCIVAALIGLDDVAIYWAEWDDETITAMRAKVIDFWNRCVLGGERPDFLVYDDVSAVYPRDNGKAIEATEVIAEKVAKLRNLKHQIKSWENEAEGLQLDIAEFVSPHSILTFEGQPILTWKAQESRRLDQEALSNEHPDLVAQFKTTTTSRVMRLKKEKL